MNVDELLAEARTQLVRLTPAETRAALEGGAVVVDIRPIEQRSHDGEIPGAHVIPRNVLEWRLDPAGAYRDPAVAGGDRQVVVVCNEGYQSSLAAATLRRLGVDATDMAGGFQAWLGEGLPVTEAAAGPATEEAREWRGCAACRGASRGSPLRRLRARTSSRGDPGRGWIRRGRDRIFQWS